MARWPSARRHHRTSGFDWIARSTRLAIYARDGRRCLRCSSPHHLTLDHIDNRRGHVPANLATMCNSCNAERGARGLVVAFGLAVALEVVEAADRPIDRALGLALAKRRWPERYAAAAARRARKRALRDAIA